MGKRITIPPLLLYEEAGRLKNQADSLEAVVVSINMQMKSIEEEFSSLPDCFYYSIQELVPQSLELARIAKEMSSWLRCKGQELEPTGPDPLFSKRSIKN